MIKKNKKLYEDRMNQSLTDLRKKTPLPIQKQIYSNSAKCNGQNDSDTAVRHISIITCTYKDESSKGKNESIKRS